jgi:hypothetical protein
VLTDRSLSVRAKLKEIVANLNSPQQVQNWLKRHTRFKLHFIPHSTSSSWLNLVERFFALITEDAVPLASSTAWPNLRRQSPTTSQITMPNPRGVLAHRGRRSRYRECHDQKGIPPMQIHALLPF